MLQLLLLHSFLVLDSFCFHQVMWAAVIKWFDQLRSSLIFCPPPKKRYTGFSEDKMIMFQVDKLTQGWSNIANRPNEGYINYFFNHTEFVDKTVSSLNLPSCFLARHLSTVLSREVTSSQMTSPIMQH